MSSIRWVKPSAKPVADFQTDLKLGQDWELKFFAKFDSTLEQADGRKFDFKIKSTNCTVELKTDMHDINGTGNFCFEKYSYDSKPGGPYQASENGVDYFIYFFPKNDLVFIFDTEMLVGYLNHHAADKPLISIPNKRHVTRVFLVPREEIEHLCLTPESIGLV